jgi:FAD/FMN-containing dehydrogenase
MSKARAFPLDFVHQHYLLLELASGDDDAALRAKLERVLAGGLSAGEIQDGVIAESLAQRSGLWLLRERVPEAEARDGGSVKHDIAVRVGDLSRFVERAESSLLAAAPHRLSIFGHIGDGNLHFNLLPPAGQTLATFRSGAAALSECVHEVAAQLNGSFSAEHGIGALKVGELERYETAEALALMRSLKNAVDPNGIMNPGKVLR